MCSPEAPSAREAVTTRQHPNLSVCFLELLEEDGGLDTVGRAPGEQLNALVRLEAGRSFACHVGRLLESFRCGVKRSDEAGVCEAGRAF